MLEGVYGLPKAPRELALVGGAEVRERSSELERFVEARCPDGCAFERHVLTLDDLRA